MAWVRRHVKDGVTTVTYFDDDGNEVVLPATPTGKKIKARQLSLSNGIVGTQRELDNAMREDAKLGVPVRYVKTMEKINDRGEKVCAWKPEFVGHHSNKNRWLRAHNRFDADAGYGDPAPGYTHGKYPQECD